MAATSVFGLPQLLSAVSRLPRLSTKQVSRCTSNHSHQFPLTISQQPIIDISLLHQYSEAKHQVIKEIREACQNFGCFKIVNHGLHQSVIEGALNANFDFFDMPDDVVKPTRFASVQDFGTVKGEYLKLYAHAVEDDIQFWPQNPSYYREKMEIYSKEVRKLGLQVIGAIMESLNLSSAYLRDELEHGIHIVGINYYEQLKHQMNIHADYSIITILLQSSPGLSILDQTSGTWNVVPELKGSLEVLVGDQLEVISNGKYKSCMHQATTTSDKSRISIVSFHNLGVDDILDPASEIVTEECPRHYKGRSLRNFLNHLASKQTVSFIETLRIE